MSRPLALLAAAAGLLLAGCSSTPDVRPVPEGVRPLAAAPEVVDDAGGDVGSDAATDAVAAADGGSSADGGPASDGGPGTPTRAEDVQVRWPDEVEGVAEAVVATVAAGVALAAATSCGSHRRESPWKYRGDSWGTVEIIPKKNPGSGRVPL